MNKTSLLLTTAIVSVGFAAGSFAATKHSPMAVKGVHAARTFAPPPAAKTVLSTSSGVGTVSGSGFTTVASQSVTVGKKGGTLAMSTMNQACGFSGSYPQAQLAAVTLVDGTYVDFGPFGGSTQPGDVCDMSNWQGIYPVAPGGHTVTFAEYHSGTVVLARSTNRTDVVK